MAPGLQLVEDPCKLCDRTVCRHRADQDGSGGLHRDVAELVLHELPDTTDPVPLQRRQRGVGALVHLSDELTDRAVDMNADHSIGREPADHRGNVGTDIAAMDSEALVPQSVHQFDPGGRDAVDCPPVLLHGCGEAEAGQGRDDDVECVRSGAAMRLGIRPPHPF